MWSLCNHSEPPAAQVLRVGVEVGTEAGEGDAVWACTSCQVAWYASGMAMDREIGLYNYRLYCRLVRLGRVMCMPWVSRANSLRKKGNHKNIFD